MSTSPFLLNLPPTSLEVVCLFLQSVPALRVQRASFEFNPCPPPRSTQGWKLTTGGAARKLKNGSWETPRGELLTWPLTPLCGEGWPVRQMLWAPEEFRGTWKTPTGLTRVFEELCRVPGGMGEKHGAARWTGLCRPTRSDQIRSVAQLCPTLFDPMNCSTPGLPVHHQLPEFTQTHVHQVSDAIQPSHPLLSPSPPAPNPSQHQSLFQWVNSSQGVAKVLEFQL